MLPAGHERIRPGEHRLQLCDKPVVYLGSDPTRLPDALAFEASHGQFADDGPVAFQRGQGALVAPGILGRGADNLIGITAERVRVDHHQPASRGDHIIARPHIPPGIARRPQRNDEFQEQVIQQPQRFMRTESGFELVLQNFAFNPGLDEIAAFRAVGTLDGGAMPHLLNPLVGQAGQIFSLDVVKAGHRRPHGFAIHQIEDFQTQRAFVSGERVAHPVVDADDAGVAARRLRRAPDGARLRTGHFQDGDGELFKGDFFRPAHWFLVAVGPVVRVVWMPVEHGFYFMVIIL